MTKLKKKAFWIVTGDIAGRGLSFATSIYLARVLGSEFYGLIIVAVSVLGYANWFADLGLINIGTRETAKEPQKRTFRIIEIFSLKLMLGISVLIAATLLISIVDTGDIEKQVILGYLYSLIPYMALMEWFYSGKQQFEKIALSKILNGLLYFLLVILLVSSSEDVTLVPVLYTAGVSIATLTLATFAIKDKPFTLPSRGLQIYPDLLKTSSILGLGSFFSQIVQLLPPLLIGALLSLHDAGIYGAAFRIIIIAMMIDRVFVNLLLPNLASLWSRDRNSAAVKIDMVYRLVAVGGALIGLITALSAEQIIQILYGDEYAGSVILLQILSVLVAFTFINSLFSFGLIATGNDKSYFLATCLGGTITALLIVIFVAMGSSVYAAVSVSLSEIIITFFTYSWFKKVVPLNYLKPILISYPLAIVLFIVFSFLPLMPIINAALASVLFLIIIKISGVLKSSQIEWVKEQLF